MKRILVLAALLCACTAQAAPEAENIESVEAQALVSPGPVRGCEVILCKVGFVCEEDCNGRGSCVPAPEKPECTTDADCRLFSDYCEGCNCVALGPDESEPKCGGTIVQCLVDPCHNLEASCQYGSCVAAGGAAQ